MTATRQSSYIEHIAYVGTTAPNHALAALDTAIAVKRCDPDATSRSGNL
jgi:hypothetical protein